MYSMASGGVVARVWINAATSSSSIGVKSPGRTILEPGISAAIAVVVGLLLSGAFTLGNFLAGGLVPFLAGLLGGWLGERRQSAGAVVTPR